MDEEQPERHFNIHTSPEVMAGVYANFANVSHSDYEFTITFARVDHEIEEEEVPGVVVSRVNVSPRFMRELIDAMEDNFSKWQTTEGIKNLPEYGDEDAALALVRLAVADALERRRVGAEQRLETPGGSGSETFWSASRRSSDDERLRVVGQPSANASARASTPRET